MTGDRRTWERFTPRERMARFVAYFGLVAAVAVSLRTIEVIPEFFYDAPEQMADLFRRMWPPDAKIYPETVHGALMETLHIATLGTVVTVFLALPVLLHGEGLPSEWDPNLHAPRGEKTEMVDLGSQRELFVDDYLVDTLAGTAVRRLHSPVPREVSLRL